MRILLTAIRLSGAERLGPPTSSLLSKKSKIKLDIDLKVWSNVVEGRGLTPLRFPVNIKNFCVVALIALAFANAARGINPCGFDTAPAPEVADNLTTL